MNRLPENLNTDNLVYFKYTPINFVNIKRLFIMYKVLLADNSQPFQFENLKKKFLLFNAIFNVNTLLTSITNLMILLIIIKGLFKIYSI